MRPKESRASAASEEKLAASAASEGKISHFRCLCPLRHSAARRASAVPSKDGPGRAVERKSQNEKLQKIEQQKELEAEERRLSNQKAAAAAAGLTHEELAC